MSRLDRDRRDAEREARRARRLAERAKERAVRKAEQAEQAAERAEKLAERVQRRPRREHVLDESIEDIVDEVTQRAEEWIDEKAQHLFDAPEEDDLDFYDDLGPGSPAGKTTGNNSAQSSSEQSSSERGTRRHHRSQKHRRKRRWGQLYRDTQRKKICGICAGVADYFGRPTWEIRFYALMGLIFIPSVILPTYFAMYFIMDDKPYYRRVTDRFDDEPDSERRRNRTSPANRRSRPPPMDSAQAMKLARGKFSDIEQRLRQMETHVTSSRFELQREFKKISGEDI